jgi:hypothetical protein
MQRFPCEYVFLTSDFLLISLANQLLIQPLTSARTHATIYRYGLAIHEIAIVAG